MFRPFRYTLDIADAVTRNNLFFAGAYHMAPVVHSGRYLQAFYGDPFRRPAMCLQYSIWALASHGHPKYDVYSDVFYRRARNYIQADEMRVCASLGHLIYNSWLNINRTMESILLPLSMPSLGPFYRHTKPREHCSQEHP